MKIPKLTRSLWMAVGLLSLPVGTAHADLKPMSHTISIDPSSPTDSWEVDLAVNVSAELTVNVASTGEKDGVTYNLNGSPTASITGDHFQLWTGDMSGNSGTFTIVNTGGTEAGSTVTVSCVWSPTAGSGSGSGGPSNINGRAIGNADIGGSSHVTWTFVPDPPIASADGSSTISWTASFSDDAGLPLSVSVSEVKGASLTPATAVWNINPTSGGGSVSTLTGTVTSTTPSTGNLQVAYDDGMAQSDTSAATLTFVKVTLTVEKSTLGLLQQNSLTAEVEPPDLSIETYKFEIQRKDQADWCEIKTAADGQFSGIARVAGFFNVRVTATLNGTEIISDEKNIEVQFPRFADIVADEGVKTAVDAAWDATKNITRTTQGRQELAFWIMLDTKAEDMYEVASLAVFIERKATKEMRRFLLDRRQPTPIRILHRTLTQLTWWPTFTHIHQPHFVTERVTGEEPARAITIRILLLIREFG